MDGGIGGILTLEGLGSIGELIGGLAVAVSLVYLAIQVRQGPTTTRAEMLQQHSLSLQSTLLAIGSDAQASRVFNAGLRSWDDLSEEEQGQFSLMMSGLFQGFESMFYQHRSGLLQEEMWQSHEARLRWYLARRGVRAWWKLAGHTWVSEQFGATINELALESEGTDL